MLPQRLFDAATLSARGEIHPNYLREHDYPWLRALIEERMRFAGELRTSFAARMKEPLALPCPKRKLRLAAFTLERRDRARPRFEVHPREIRRALFHARARDRGQRDALLGEIAASLKLDPARLDALLFADLPSEQRLGAVEPALTPGELALAVNEDLVRGLVARAARIEIKAWGNTRALVRSAQLRGLICTVHPAARSGVRLDISGAFALFRHTNVYGRALGALVPRAQWCDRFELRAEIALGRSRERAMVLIQSGDPIPPAPELERYDSKLEAQFAKDFARIAKDWDLHREPRPFIAGAALVFPDFELVHRYEPRRRFMLEIVGFWTDVYLRQKLERLAQARIQNLILCIDESRRCSEHAMAPNIRGAVVIPYRRRIDAHAVLAVVDP